MGFARPTGGVAMYHVIRKYKIIFFSFSILFAFSRFAAAEDSSCKIIEANHLGTMMGLPAEQERKLSTKSDKRPGRAIGVWLDEMLGKITIQRQNGMIVLVEQFGDGSIWNMEMIERQESGRWWYVHKGENAFEEYYVIDHSGDLGVYDREGLLRTLRPVR
jgi:hypothetical protein